MNFQSSGTPIEHPAYSPDIALAGERFDDDAHVEQYVLNWLLEHCSFHDEEIKKLLIWWHKCISAEEDYAEK